MHFSDRFLLDILMYLFRDSLIEVEHSRDKDDHAKQTEQLSRLKIQAEWK